MSNPPLAIYLSECRARRSTGAVTPETSLYGPLEQLLTTVGTMVRPGVRAFMSLKNRDGNMPDGGLFTPDQFDKDDVEAPVGQLPSRGVIECKTPKDDLLAIADSPQVSRYWNQYSQVLVTNYREFVLLGRDDAGQRVRYEHFVLADSERAFWTADAAALVATLEAPFLDFLKRCLLRPAPISEPKDVAWFLASYARDAKSRMERAGNVPALLNVQRALEQALGLSFETAKEEEGRRFFRSTLVQTLFYGVFSAWVLWHRSHPTPSDRFDWEKAAKYLRVPVLRKLFHELAEPGKLVEWKLEEVLNWAGDVLNRVDRAAFFSRFHDTEAVQYFYEPFLEQFDPELRKQLGVWYTPPEIVKYMVGRVDQILRDDLGREDGLADESVYVLDPCCGTGAYLVEVLRRIEATMTEQGVGPIRASKLKKAVTERIFGFELLPAPFVVAHLQIGLLLQEVGAEFHEVDERAGIYLTNSLTGWDPKIDATKSIFEEFNKEREAAELVKRKKPILVILGNPPYNGYAGIAVAEERALSDTYRWKFGDPEDLKPQGQGLNDLYIRFFRMAERCILGGEASEGVVSFISNYSWLDGLSFPLMRQKYLEGFDTIWIDDLHGNRIVSEYAPDGRTSETVFALQGKSPGIRIGTAIATMVRKTKHKPPAKVLFRDWQQAKAQERRAALLESLAEKNRKKNYTPVVPIRELGLPFRPMITTAGYLKWPLLPDLYPTYFNGVQTSRDDVVVDIDKSPLEERIKDYFDKSVSDVEMRRISPRAMEETQRFQAVETRRKLQQRGYLPSNIMKFAYRPMDTRWLYWEPETKLLDEKRAEYVPHTFPTNVWFSAVQQNRKDYDPPVIHKILGCRHLIERGANVFPMLLKEDTNGHSLFGDTGRVCHELGDHCVNLTDPAVDYLEVRGKIKATPSLFFHTMAVLHAPQYAVENKDALRQVWPRVPLPNDAKLLKTSGILGQQIAALLDTDKPVNGVTTGKVRAELRLLGDPSCVGGGRFHAETDFAVTAHWGTAGKGGICMPSTGKAIEREYTVAERASLGDGIALLGETTFDIYLNERAYWQNVPSRVWTYTLGGYQVLKKWLSYREFALLGRPLGIDEVEYVQHVVRRIAALRLMGPELDANYASVKADLYEWPSG